jgi:hypothetical protein
MLESFIASLTLEILISLFRQFSNWLRDLGEVWNESTIIDSQPKETSHTKKVTNELSFPLVTHTTHFSIRFSCYGILKSYSSSEQVMDRLDCSCSVRFLSNKMGETC